MNQSMFLLVNFSGNFPLLVTLNFSLSVLHNKSLAKANYQ